MLIYLDTNVYSRPFDDQTQPDIQKATQFVLLLERGKGDSVQEIIDYGGNASIDEIHNRVVAWKAKQQSISRPIERPSGV